MDDGDKRKLEIHRGHLLDDLAIVQPILDGLIERGLLSPQSDEYQTILAGGYAREQTRRLLDILPSLGPRAFAAFLESLASVRPHLRDALLQEAPADEEVCDGSRDEPDSAAEIFPKGSLPDPSSDPTVPEIVGRLRNKLRRTFVQASRKASVVDFKRKPTTLEKVLVTVSSMSFDDVQAGLEEMKLSDHTARAARAGKRRSAAYTNEVASKSFVSRCGDEFELRSVGQLLRSVNGERVDSCLVVGPAGTGKSLLLEWVMLSWAEGSVQELNPFEIVACVRGKDLNDLCGDTPTEMLGCVLQRQYHLSDSERRVLEHYIERNSEKVLVLLDSADEGGDAWAKSNALEMLFDRRGLEDCTFIATSRPCSLAHDLVPSCTQRFYLVGFNDQRLDELLVRRLGEENGTRFAAKLRQPSWQSVRELMKETPLVANMVAELAKRGEESLPASTTRIYTAMALDMVRRHHSKSGSAFGHGEVADTFHGLPAASQAALEELSRLALSGFLQRRCVFDMKTVQGMCKEEALRLGFLEEYEVEASGGATGVHHEVEFRHLTWLEYFAAYSLSCLSDSPCQAIHACVEAMGATEEMMPFWKFVCGLIDSKNLLEVIELLKADYLYRCHSELEKRQWVRLVCSWIAEAAKQPIKVGASPEVQRADLERATAIVIPPELDVANMRLSVVDSQSISTTLQHSPHIHKLDVRDCGMKGEHCLALQCELVHIDCLDMSGNRGLHEDGLDSFASVAAQGGVPALRSLTLSLCSLDVNDSAAVEKLLCSIPTLEELLIGANNLGSSGISQLQKPLIETKLRVLDLSSNKLDCNAGRALGAIVQDSHHLAVLALSHNELRNDGVDGLLQGVECSRSLQHVDLGNTTVDEGVVDTLSRCLSNRSMRRPNSSPTKPLRILLHGNSLRRQALEDVARRTPSTCKDVVESDSFRVRRGVLAVRDVGKMIRRHMKQTDECDLGNRGIDGEGAKQIASLLTESSAVRTLDLWDNSVDNVGAAALGRALEVNTTLRGLGLARNRVGPAGFASLTTSLTTANSTLSFLDLHHNPLFRRESPSSESTSWQSALYTLVSETAGIRCLGLGHTGLGDAGCEVVGSALSSQRCRLTNLDLDGNTISSAGIMALCSGLEQNSTIKYVSLCHNEISDEGAERISRCLTSRAQQDSPLLRVWLKGNPADPRLFTSCMVNDIVVFTSIVYMMETYS